MRMLMVLHMPWSRDLGGPRVSVELADEFRARGVEVDKFDIDDAFPNRTRLSSFFEQAQFPARAIEYVRRHGHKYDIVQAEQGCLPCTKEQLNFRGVLGAHSSGLAHMHKAAVQAMPPRASGGRRGSVAGRVLRWSAEKMSGGLADIEHSFDAADAIFVLNRDELDFMDSQLGCRGKTYLKPNGLSEQRFAEFAAARVELAVRLASQRVVFIGHWAPTKGSADFPRIVRAIRTALPSVRFLFLGTNCERGDMIAPFDPADRDAIEVVAKFESPQLPALLKDATVGVFPSYMEGFGIGVLEKLAAGIPTAAYDIPGPRDMLRLFHESMRTPLGDSDALAARVAELLKSTPAHYADLSAQAEAIASKFRWRDIADMVLAVYGEKVGLTDRGGHPR